MPLKQPRFDIGAAVCERVPGARANQEAGTVMSRYEYGDDFRYVVKFEDGREEVFFERELLSMPPLSDGNAGE
jgi:hypothetical protein